MSDLSLELNLGGRIWVLKPFARLVADTSMATVYGIDIATEDLDGSLSKVIETLRQFAEPLLLPGGYLLEMFPFLQHLPSWIPGLKINKTLDTGRRAMRSILDRLDVMSTVATVSSSHYGFNHC